MKRLIRKWLGLENNMQEISNMLAEIRIRLLTIEEKTQGMDGVESVKMNSPLEYILGTLSAIQEYLKGRAVFYYVNDPSIKPPERPKVRQWKFEKNRKKVNF